MPAKREELDALLQQCARELPVGYQVVIKVECGSGWLDLIDPDGNNIEYPSNHEYGLAEDAFDALTHAKELVNG